MTLEQELIEVFTPTSGQRNREILAGYYGWDDGRQHTLAEIGARFGITRERVRQVCAKLTRRLNKPSAVPTPAMDRALALIAQRLPCSAAQIEAELVEQDLTAIGMSIECVAVGAKLLGRPTPFAIVEIGDQDKARTKGLEPEQESRDRWRIAPNSAVEGSAVQLPPQRSGQLPPQRGAAPVDGRLAIRPDQREAALAAVDLAKKEVYFHGLSTVERIVQMVFGKEGASPAAVQAGRKLIRQTLVLMEGFCWLDEPTGWFRLLPIDKHGLPKAVDKVLAVAGSVTAGQLRSALGRNRRLWKEPPPEKVLLAFCRQMPRVRVEGDRIVSDPPRDWRKALTGVEAKLVEVLKAHGPAMERGAMEDLCVAGGMNRFSFHAFISWSPVIAQCGHSLYGLLGSEVSRSQVEELLSRRRANRLSHRVLDSHGRTDDGRVWLGYRLSKAASTYAVITVPAALKRVVRGRFQLLSSDGRRIGTLATKDGRAWGLGAFLREHGARIDDRIILTLDLEKRTAAVSWAETETTQR